MKTIKKVSILVVMFLITATGFSQQNKWKEVRKNKALKFAEVAAKEFDLSKDQQTALYKRKLQQFEEQQVANKKAKKGNITKEEKKKPNQAFGAYFRKLTGKNFKQLKPFFKKVNAEMKKIKVKS